MALLDAPVDSRTAVGVVAPARDVAVACGCGVACSACAGVAWAGGLFLAESLFGWRAEPTTRRDQLPAATLAMTGIGALAGFVASASVWLLRIRLTQTGLLVIVGCTATGALGGALTPAMVVAFDPRLPAHLGSSLAWAVAAFLAGYVGYQVSRRFSGGESALSVAEWALAPAILTAAVWGIGLTVDQQTTGGNFARTVAAEWNLDAVLALTARAAGVGVVTGMLVSLVLVGDGRGFGHRTAHAVAWGVRLGIATGVGTALSWLGVLAVRDVFGPEISSTLGFAATGLIAGLSAPGRPRAAPPPDDSDDDEADHAEPPGEGVAYRPANASGPAMPLSPRSILRLLPLCVVSLGSLVAAAVVAPSHAALALVAVGLLGFTVIPVLWSQERRLAALERRFHFPKRD